MAKSILICDDAAFMRMMIKDILVKNGYNIAGEAENGVKAVEKYQETKPDLVLMDITMPEMDGIQALKKIKAIDANASVVMCSAMGQQAMVIESIQSGARDFIVKPFQPDRVIEAVKKAVERYHPKLAFIYASCASGIIGDDIDAIAYDLQEEYPDTVLVPIHCEGFKSKICASGFDAAFLAINKYILKKESVPKEKGLVNLFAPTTVSYADQKEMERMLHNIGVEVNYIPFYSSLEKIKRIPAAEASTSICKVFADEFMKTLWEDYEIPYSHTVMPIGIRNTEKWYRGIAKVLGKEEEVEEIIAKERERIMPLVQKLRDRLQGKRAFICGGTGRSFAAAALIDDFGMELVGLETPTYDEDAQTDIEYLNGIHKDFVVDIANMQPFEQVNLVNKLKPDAFIGVPDWAAKLGIPTTHVLDGKRPTMGYDGLIYLGNKIADQLQNPGFNVKLAQHSKLPYKDSWYEQDAFKYIKK